MPKEIRLELVLRAATLEGEPVTVAEVVTPLKLQLMEGPSTPPYRTASDAAPQFQTTVEMAASRVNLTEMTKQLTRLLTSQLEGAEIALERSGRTLIFVDVGSLEPRDALEYVTRVRDQIKLRDDELLVPYRRGDS